MEITSIAPPGRQIIESYGTGRFRVSGCVYDGGIIVTPDETVGWPVAAFSQVTFESFGALLARQQLPDLLLLGCGTDMALPDPALRAALRERGILLESMASGAACRTYNVLMGEERFVAAALIAVD